MKPCLADVNVLLALLPICATSHSCACWEIATSWETTPVSAANAWRLIDELAQDERIAFVSEPALLDSMLPTLLNSPVPTGKLIGDAYLTAFSIVGSRSTEPSVSSKASTSRS